MGLTYAELPPPSVVALWPNTTDHPDMSRRHLLKAVDIPLTTLALLVLFLRLVIRYRTKSFGNDDIIMVINLPFIIGMMVINCMLDLGMHIWDIKPRIEWNLMIFYAYEFGAIFSHSLIKISLLFFYRRVFYNVARPQLLINIGFAYVITCTLTLTLVTLFQCMPMQANWNLALHPRKCLNFYALVTAISASGCLSNFYLFCLPLPELWRLRLPRNERIGLMFTFGVGLVTCIISVIKMYYMTVPFTVENRDFTWEALPGMILCHGEVDLSIICVSLPALKHLITRKKSASITSYGESGKLSKERNLSDTHISGESYALDGPKHSASYAGSV